MTGALDVPMSKVEAESVTMSIRYTLKAVASSWAKAVDLMEKAEAGGAWKVLGHPSWTAYVTAEFGDILKGISRDDRRPVVAKMRELGMSTRAIGEVVGVDQKTVVNDLRAGEEASSPAKVTGKDGKTYPVRKARTLPSGKLDAATVEAMGKAVPPVRRRPPLIDQFNKAGADLGRVIARLRKLTEDDRFQHDPDKFIQAALNRTYLDADRATLRLLAAATDRKAGTDG